MVNEEMDAADAGHRQRLDIVMAEIADSNHCLERLYDAEDRHLKVRRSGSPYTASQAPPGATSSYQIGTGTASIR